MMPDQVLSGARRRLLAVATIAGLALVATACAPQATDTPETSDSDAPVTLRLAVTTQGPVASPYGVMAERYSEENPNVTFEIEEIPNEQYSEVIRTQLQGGNAPDIFYVTGGRGDTASVIPLAESGNIIPLTGTVAEELLVGDGRKVSEYEGEIWAHPLDFVPVTNNYNLTVAEELGIELPFETERDVLEACEVASDAGKTLLRLAGSAIPNNGLTTLQMAASRVYLEDPEWTDKRLAGEVTFADSEGWRESIEMIITLRDAGCFQIGPEAGVVSENAPAIAAGDALGAFAPAGQTGDLKRLQPENEYVTTVFPGPDGESRLFASPTNLLAINAAADEAKENAAKDFFAWLAEPENADATAELSGNLSIRAGTGGELPEQFRFIGSYFEDENYQTLATQFWPSAGVYQALGTGVQGLLTGQTTVDAVLQAMDDAWDAAS